MKFRLLQGTHCGPNPVDEESGVIVTGRTEICDATHKLVTIPGMLEIPRRCNEVDEYALEMTNLVKVLEEDKKTGGVKYRYKALDKTGHGEHYRHATNYFKLACEDENLRAKVRNAGRGFAGNRRGRKNAGEYDPLANMMKSRRAA